MSYQQNNDGACIVGVSSGIGRYLVDNVPRNIPIARHDSDLTVVASKPVVFCSVNRDISSKTFIKDNFEFLFRLSKAKPSHLVLISTIDLYRREQSAYSFAKSFQEKLVNLAEAKVSILRLPMVLGCSQRTNHIDRMRNNGVMTLAGTSTFNYISGQTIINALGRVISQGITGTFDIVSNKTLSLEEIQCHFNWTCEFGDFVYATPMSFPNTADWLEDIRPNPITIIEEYLNR